MQMRQLKTKTRLELIIDRSIIDQRFRRRKDEKKKHKIIRIEEN